MLKFLEALDIVSDEGRPLSLRQSMVSVSTLPNGAFSLRLTSVAQDAEQLREILKLFHQGALLMDEVDLILHPLKSELNFPIGMKHDLVQRATW